MEDSSNNVISFASKKALRDCSPVIDIVAKFKQRHSDNLPVIEMIVGVLIEDLIEEFGILPETIQMQDYILLLESTMGLLMRCQGLEHPLMHPIADELLSEE